MPFRRVKTGSFAFQRRKTSGVSEIIASLLMILVVISLSIVVFGLATNGFNNYSSGLTNLFSNSGDALAERVAIEQITFNESGSQLGANIYVRDVGSNAVTISAVYVTNVTANVFVLVYRPITNTMQVTQFENIAITFTPDAGSTYSFNVATQRGNTILANAKA